jgi:hypothetical protein
MPSSVLIRRIVLQLPMDDASSAVPKKIVLSQGWEWRQEGSDAVLLLPFEAIRRAPDLDSLTAGASQTLRSTLQPPLWSALAVPHMTVSVEYSLGAQVYTSTREVEISSRAASMLMATLFLLGFLLLSGWVLNQGTWRSQEPQGLLRALLSLIVNPLGSYSLSMAQVLAWTLLSLFGVVFLWLMTDGTPQVPGQILELLGIGSGTAVLSRLANGDKQSLPARYLRLVPYRGEPVFSDLVSVEGRPNIFKFQMLGFTGVTAIVLLHELYVGCRFAIISDSLVTLMGLSSATYLGNEVMQRGPWERVRQQISKIEALAQEQGVSFSEELTLQRWMQEALVWVAREGHPSLPESAAGKPADGEKSRTLQPLHRELLTLRALLLELYSERAPSEVSPTSSQPPAPPSPQPVTV